MKSFAENAQKDRLPCPDCGENWMYGWFAHPSGQIKDGSPWGRPDKTLGPTKLKNFLAEKKQWRCGKCRKIFKVSDGVLGVG